MATRRRRELADYRRFEMEDEVPDRLQFASKSDDVELVESDDDFCESYHNKLKELKRKLKLSISHEVLYLDYVDFGPRRLPHTFPCISFWMRYD